MERLQRKCKVCRVKPWGVVGLAAAAERLEASGFRLKSARPVYSPEIGVSGRGFRGSSDSLILAINDSGVKESKKKKELYIVYYWCQPPHAPFHLAPTVQNLYFRIDFHLPGQKERYVCLPCIMHRTDRTS